MNFHPDTEECERDVEWGEGKEDEEKREVRVPNECFIKYVTVCMETDKVKSVRN